jgi:hypothetical protein
VGELVSFWDHAGTRLAERDLHKVEVAITLVVLGAATRVTIGNLADPEAVLGAAVARGQWAGVGVRGDRSTGRLAIQVGPTR